MKAKTFLLVLVNLFLGTALAQETSQTGDFIQGGIADGNKLIDAYTAPLNKAVIFSLGESGYAGFYLAGNNKFSIGIKTVFLMAPESERTFHVNDLGLQTLEASDPHNDKAQTIFGDSTSYVYIQSKRKILGQPAFKFKSPTGSGYPGFPIPYIDMHYHAGNWNLSLGVIPLVPVPTTDLNIFMVRTGLQYNLTSLAGLNGDRSELSATASAAYFHGYSYLDVKPGKVSANSLIPGSHNGPYDNQRFLIDYTSFSLSTHYAYLLGKHWRIFAGAGVVGGTSSLKLKGTYPVYETDPSGTVGIVAKDIEDPLDIPNFYGTAFAEAGLRADWNKWYLQFQGNLGNYMGGSLALGYKF